MSNRLSGSRSLAYQGTNAAQPPNMFMHDRAPTPNDYQNISVGDFWIHRISRTSNDSELYVLLGVAGNVADWVLISSTAGTVLTLTGDTGGAVDPDGAGNINILSAIAGLTVDGDPLTNTLTLNSSGGGGLLETLTGDSGGAVSPDVAGNIDVVGDGATIDIVGNPGTNTLTVSAISTGLIQSLTGNSGGAVFPTAGNTNIVGDGVTVNVVGNPGTSTLTISTAVDGIQTITGDTGGPLSGANITFTGGTTGLSFNGAATTETLVFAGITANGGTVSLATDATNSTINVGTGAGIKTSTFGSTNTTSSTAIQSGTGNVAINAGLTIDSTGRNYNTVQPAFSAYLASGGGSATGDATNYTVGFNGEIFDQGGVFDTGTFTFTAPINGRYYLSTMVRCQQYTAAFSESRLVIRTSNRDYEKGQNGAKSFETKTSDNYYGMSNTVLADMDAADTAIVRMQVSGSTKTIDVVESSGGSERTNFMGYLAC